MVRLLIGCLVCLVAVANSWGDEPSQRREKGMQFHLAAQQRTGILVPMYVYPENVHTNVHFNRLIEIKRRFETVPIWVIVNPASGPGIAVDANYTKAIDRLQGAGCVVLGYVSTEYGKRDAGLVKNDIDTWKAMYPKTQGIFFDEMNYQDDDSWVNHQVRLNQYAKQQGFWPTVSNPGADTPGKYFAAEAADVIVIHEGSKWPEEERIHGNYFGGYSDYPPFTRAVLLHSMAKVDPAQVQMVRKYARWIYVTEDPYKPGDPTADNPWDKLSAHMETLCQQLSKP
ncbi:MAG: spherulation-specific family 4 protein [Planctomycetaceae bacterium]